MRWLIGKTGYSFFDVWTLVHLAFWFFAGSLVWSSKMNRLNGVVSCVVVALLWEVFERYAEKRWPTLWLNPESWWNSWLSDPLTCVVGVLAACYALDHWRT